MTDAEIITALRAEIAQLRSEAVTMKFNISIAKDIIDALAKRSGDLERSAMLVASQATELCRQLRGGSMEHLRTEP